MSAPGKVFLTRTTRLPSAIVSLAAFVAVALIAACGGEYRPPPSPSVSSLAEIGAGLQGPAGLSATLAADGLANISALAADSQGRLWAATATFTDTGDDAVYPLGGGETALRPVITTQHTPMGLLWVGDELYVSSAGGVLAYTGFDRNRSPNSARCSPSPPGQDHPAASFSARTAASESASPRPAATARPPPRSRAP